MEVIFRREGSVRMRLLDEDLLFGVAAEEFLLLEEAVLEVEKGVPVELGRRDCVRKVRLVSTCESCVRIVEQMASMISSSLRKLTSRFVGCTLTSTRWGSMSNLK